MQTTNSVRDGNSSPTASPAPGVARWVGLVALLWFLAMTGTARSATLVHEFYLPMPEAQLRQSLVTLETNISTTLDSVFSVVVTGPGTRVYYDHWEDGYEVNLASPAQATTQVWGDGNNANGIAPGFVNDPPGLPVGTVLALRNLVPLPRNPSQTLYDARDRVAATKALVVSRAAWATTPGPVFADAVEVTATMDHGTHYISPIGQNLTNRFFQYVGATVMAGQDNTQVTVDPDGAGPAASFAVNLNRGESHLVNGGLLAGATFTSTRPVQVHLLIGRYGGRYVTDWFTLTPVADWSASYFTPVGTAANGQKTFIYAFNPHTTNLTVNYLTQVGSGSFVVPPGGVTQFEMPQNSGGRFQSAGGAPFTALAKVGGSPGAESAYDWGFTLLPADSLTTEAVVGWGPGSSDGSVNGSPVWVTAPVATRVYVDFNGDRAGALTDPNGGLYDAHYDLAALESRRVFDPDQDQTAMRLYTVNGTVISAAWGQDPATAAPGNPYLDLGTTVLPFPVPVLRKSFTIFEDTGTPGLSVGDTLEYTVELDNRGLLPLGNVLVIDELPTNLLAYVTNTTTWNGNPIPDSPSGTAFPLDAPGFTIPIILRDGTSRFTFRTVTVAPGNITNVVSAVGYSLVASAVATPPAGGGSTQCGLTFADAFGSPVASYTAAANVHVRLTDADANTSPSTPQTVSVVVRNLTGGDIETITLTETGNNTGIFQNTTPLPSSLTAGLFQQDGTLNALPGHLLSVAFTDPIYSDTCSANAIIEVPSLTKVLYLSGTNAPDQALDRIDPVAAGDNTTAQTAVLEAPGAGVIAVETTSTNAALSPFSSLAVSHTTGTGSNRFMLVTVAFEDDNTAGPVTVSNVTYAGNPLTRIARVLSPQEAGVELWQLANPPSGAGTVTVNFTGVGNAADDDSAFVAVTTFTGVHPSVPVTRTNTATGSTGTASISIVSTNGELVFATLAVDDSRVTTAGTNQTTLWNGRTETGDDGVRSTASTKPGAASVTNSWTFTADAWAAVAVTLQPAPAGGGSNAVTFTQAPAFCAGFSLPSNSVVRVTNHVTVTSGSLPASPAVTATLRYGATTFAHLTNAAYNSASNWIVWSGTLASNVNIPAGQAIAFTVTNNQAGAAFRIQYDSAARPSKIALPTTTIIQVDSFAVYDAPHPGGSPVSTPPAGSLLYVRATVSDPFGAYDITGLGLAVDGPGVAHDFTTNLTDLHVVASDSCAKTYQFAWQTGANPGGYNLSATASEGTEGITANATASLTLTFLDLGTPSTTAFTSGNNGPATNAYAPNSSVCVRVTDADKNTNAATVETITVTVASGSGDAETLTLTETGSDTGLFTGCLPASATLGTGTNNGTLNAPAGTVLNVTYTDPADPTDTSSATATVLTPPGVPGLAITKTLVTPADGQAGVSETLQFNLLVVNSGSTVLTNVLLTDTFPAANFTYVSASLTPDVVGAGTLSWTNLGNFTPGQSLALTVNFTASAAAAATNRATARVSGVITNTATASVSITTAALTIIKTVLTPTNGPVPIGSNITYRVTVQNSGTVAIPTLPLEDTFSAAQLQFVSATVTPDGVGAGSLLWNDITGAGSLAPGATLTIDVTLVVVGAGEPTVNTARADYAEDALGRPVPPAVGAASIDTGAARITGHVYHDLDQSGTLTGGDTGLASVTVSLYTDPDGDGNPADGVLIRLVATGAAGDYELLNLATGAYVVVQTDLPGFASVFPLNNRLSVNVTNLAAYTNVNFFDYQPAPALYSTFTGRVFNDVDGNGTNTAQAGLALITLDLVQDVNTNGLADPGEPVAASTLTDTNGHYSFVGVTPGHYVIRQTDAPGYYSSGDSQPPNDSQISLVTTNGVTLADNHFFDRLRPVAVNDTATAGYQTPATFLPLANDLSPNGDVLTIAAATSAHGLVTINPGATNLTFTPNVLGTATIQYTAVDAFGGSSNAVISVTVTSTVPTITWSPVGPITYGTPLGTNQLNATLSVPGTPVYNPTNGTVLPVGTNILSVTYTPTDTNYAPVSTTRQLVVLPATLNVTAASQTRAFGQPNAPLTYSLTGFVNDESTNVVSGSPVLSTAATTNSPVGVYPITVGLGSLSASNYVFTLVNGSVTVTSSVPVITWAPVGPITYGTPLGTNQNNATLSVPGTPVYNPTNGTVLPVGTNLLSVVFTPTDTNYAPVSTTRELVVLPATLTVTAASQTRAFGQTNAPLTYSLTGFVNGESTNVVSGSPVLSTAATTNSPVGVYPITVGLGSLSASNYVFTLVNGTLTVTPSADVAVFVTGPTTVNPGQTITNIVTVTNLGPSGASNVLTTVLLPTNGVFVSATGGPTLTNGLLVWPPLAFLPNGGATNFLILLTAPTNGTLVTIGSATSATADPNPANNNGSGAGTLTALVVPVQFGVRAGTNVFNPQTGLFEQTVIVTNTSLSTVAALRVLAGDFASTNGSPRTNVWLWNAHGTNFDGRRFVQYNAPLDPGQFVSLRLEYYNPTRVPFTNSLTVEATLPVASTNLTGGVVIDRAFVDNREAGNPRFVIEWTSLIGRNYTVIYGPTPSGPWTPATPTVTATATRVQWYDDGPPKTATPPLSVTNRFYRVILNP